MALPPSRLCIFCHCIEATDKPCPRLQNPSSISKESTSPFRVSTPWTAKDEALLESLRQKPSSLCQRCRDYDIVNILKTADPLDDVQFLESTRLEGTNRADPELWQTVWDEQKRHILYLGRLSSFLLTPTCQLCRLIYRTFPRPSLDHDHTLVRLDPFRWYVRHQNWEIVPVQAKQDFSILVGYSVPQIHQLLPFSLHDQTVRPQSARMTGESIALDSRHLPMKGKATSYNARCVDSIIDFKPLKVALDNCLQSHPTCQLRFHQELSTTRMIDVAARKVVACPPQCEYLALSYVWGGIIPPHGALEAKTLPQTIEDAITITEKLGRRYLWVDALCIDQTPNPTPEQAASKQQQLAIMHLIYSGAALTIYAVSGKNSASGLKGVSSPRIPQTREIINGHTLFTVPSDITQEVNSSIWDTRAWTFQERALGRRSLYITDTQCQFQCGANFGPGQHSEAFDTAKIDGSMAPFDFLRNIDTNASKEQARLRATWGNTGFDAMLQGYTSRKLTNAEDSLDAFKGILNSLLIHVYPGGFLWGLPLYDAPKTLGWSHDALDTPKRRPNFPSWSWAGWEGKVRFLQGLVSMEEEEDQGQAPKFDLLTKVKTLNGKELTVRGWAVDLEIRTEPFSEVVVPGSSETVGCVKEMNALHNNTLPSGKYMCLVVARVKQGILKNGRENQRVFMITLKGAGRVMERQTIITLDRLAAEGKDFMDFKPVEQDVVLV